MNFVQIVDIIMTIAVLALGAYGAYKGAGKTIYSKMSYLIAEAAKLDLIGAEKMKQVVDKLYSYVPTPFKKILTKDKLEAAAQGVYNNMKDFSETEKSKKE